MIKKIFFSWWKVLLLSVVLLSSLLQLHLSGNSAGITASKLASLTHLMLDVGDWLEGLSSPPGAFQTVVLEKTLESPLDQKEIKPINPKENQPWIFIGRSDAKAEAPILCPPDAKNWLTGNDSDAGQEDEIVGWHHQVKKHEFELALGVGDGQGSLVCCSSWGCKESDMS